LVENTMSVIAVATLVGWCSRRRQPRIRGRIEFTGGRKVMVILETSAGAACRACWRIWRIARHQCARAGPAGIGHLGNGAGTFVNLHQGSGDGDAALGEDHHALPFHGSNKVRSDEVAGSMGAIKQREGGLHPPAP
jgi:hypothetical protein